MLACSDGSSAPAQSVTFDNDTTFAQARLLANQRDMTTWFCDA